MRSPVAAWGSLLVLVVFVTILAVGTRGEDGVSPKDRAPAGKERAERERPERVIKSDEEWARLLTRDQFLVTRLKGTEPPFSGKYVRHHARGVYACVCCGAELFDSRTKFNSGTGWPSFYRPIADDCLETDLDYRMVTERVEVLCSTCGAHLGHVFDDGPRPTGLRYCINSVALKFVPQPTASRAKKPASKATTSPSKAAPKRAR